MSMESNVSKVLYEESIPVLVNSVSSFIEERGYAVEKTSYITEWNDHRLLYSDGVWQMNQNNYIGVYGKCAIRKLFGKGEKVVDKLIGTLVLNRDESVFHVYGRQNLGRLDVLRNEISDKYNIRIKMTLEMEY